MPIKANLNTFIKGVFQIKKFPFDLFFAFILSCVSRFFFLASLYAYKIIIDHVDKVSNVHVQLATGLFFLYFGTRVFSELLTEVSNVTFFKVGQKSIKNHVVRVFEHLTQVPADFFWENNSSKLIRIINKGIKSLEFLYQSIMVYILPSLIELCVIFSYISWKLDYKFSLSILVSFVLYCFLNYFSTRLAVNFRVNSNEIDYALNQHCSDALRNNEAVRAYNLQALMSGEYKDLMNDYSLLNSKAKVIDSFFNFMKNLMVSILSFGFIYSTSIFVQDGSIRLGDFVLINTLVYQVFQPLTLLNNLYGQMRQSFVDIFEMFNLTQKKAEEVYSNKPRVELKKISSIRFNQVSFNYPNKRCIEQLSLHLKQGEAVGIVGVSGAGKSTISKLLLKMYEPCCGEIMFGDINASKLSTSFVRDSISVAPQQVNLFNNTILYNLTFNQNIYSHRNIVMACKNAGIYEFIMSQKEQFMTKIGEDGLTLSGGERQRIGLARALLKRSSILILDEATSALDVKNEHNIIRNIMKHKDDRITVVITHRLSLLMELDKILVMDNGMIIEEGPHLDLINQRGHYHHLWSAYQQSQNLFNLPNKIVA